MNQEQIHSALDKMLESPKSRNFINHLVRAYMPVSKVEKVWETPKGDFKCVLTKAPLFSVQTIMDGMQTEEYKENFMQHLKMILVDGQPKVENPIINLVGDKEMALTGKDTNTFMSNSAFQEFYNWVVTKSLKGDKHINWLLGSVRRESFLKRAETIQDEGVQNKVKKMTQPKVKQTGYAMGEASDVLVRLKEQMLKNENK
jgi:hypothetical protein